MCRLRSFTAATFTAALLTAATANATSDEYGINGANLNLSTTPMLHNSDDGTNTALPTVINYFNTIDDGDWYWAEIDLSIFPAIVLHGMAYLVGAELGDWTPSPLMGPPTLSGPSSYAFFNRLGRGRIAFTYPMELMGKLRVGLVVDGDIIYIGRGDNPYAVDASEGVNILAGLGPTAMWCPIPELSLKLSLVGMGAFTGGGTLDFWGGAGRVTAEVFYEFWENTFWAFGRVAGNGLFYGDETPNLSGGSTLASTAQLGLQWNIFQFFYDLFGD